MHLRLLDDFLGHKADRPSETCKTCGHTPPTGDVTAQHYLPDWKPVHALGHADRQAINAEVVHLSERRKELRDWPIVKMARECYDVLRHFLEQLEASPQYSYRSEYFTETQQLLDHSPLDQSGVILSNKTLATTASDVGVISDFSKYVHPDKGPAD